mmetsp:Transcript_88252/g.252329  ORF Transcript_88252/g.252329 Transcript_88252/m.252329 type:complete len:144 (+) Transcript_88252:664-1095(+)
MVLCRAKLCSRLPCNLPSDLLTTHNAPLTTYYPSPATRCPLLRSYMTSAPVFQMVWKGKGAVEAGRAILGETNPLASPAGDLGISFLKKSSFCFLIFAQHILALLFQHRISSQSSTSNHLGPVAIHPTTSTTTTTIATRHRPR